MARSRQRGISLLVVMIVVLLSSLLALWAFRTALVNETIVGNDADYQRAFEAAQSMLQDAELDIRGERADGSVCVGAAAAEDASEADVAAAGRVCRVSGTLQFIEENKDLFGLLATLGAEPTRCRDAICQKRTGIQDFWDDDDTFAAMIAPNIGARYGQYTGALPPAASTAMVNPLLTERAETRGAWYWIEVMPYADAESGLLTNTSEIMMLNLAPRVVYRITAVARGIKPNTQVVLQSTFVRQKLRD